MYSISIYGGRKNCGFPKNCLETYELKKKLYVLSYIRVFLYESLKEFRVLHLHKRKTCFSK